MSEHEHTTELGETEGDNSQHLSSELREIADQSEDQSPEAKHNQGEAQLKELESSWESLAAEADVIFTDYDSLTRMLVSRGDDMAHLAALWSQGRDRIVAQTRRSVGQLRNAPDATHPESIAQLENLVATQSTALKRTMIQLQPIFSDIARQPNVDQRTRQQAQLADEAIQLWNQKNQSGAAR